MKLQDAIDGVCEKEPLFTNMVTRLKPVQDDEGCPTLGTDGEFLFYNQKFLDSLTEKEACAVVLHEIFHCAFKHQWRRENRDHLLWNVATDYAINTLVNESFPLPAGSLIDTKYSGMSGEEIYELLKEDIKKQEGNGSGQGNGSGPRKQGWCEKDHWEGKKRKEKGKGAAGELMDKLSGKSKPVSTMTEAEKEEMWEDLLEETFSHDFGKLPQNLQRVISKMVYVPVVDWASLVSQLLSEDITDYTFSTPDRRFLDSDFIMPSMHSMDRLKDVVFAYDTSGSISSSDLKAFYEETLALFATFPNLQGHIAICDADLHHFKEADPSMKYSDFRFTGGGGTDFRPVFNVIDTLNMRPKALFYFTDTYGSFPHNKPDYPVFWLVRSRINERDALRVPFGEVIRFLSRSSR